MKKTVVVVIVSLILVIAGSATLLVVAFSTKKTPAPVSGQQSSNSNDPAILSSACSILTSTIAKDILSANTVTQAGTSTLTTYADGIVSSNCNYLAGSDGVSLIVRAATNDEGAASNKSVFQDKKPAGAESIDDLSAPAFYLKDLGQLHILKQSTWYIVTRYKKSTTNATLDGNLEAARKMQLI